MRANLKKTVETVLIAFTFIGSVVGGLAYLENRYAMAEEVKKLERRLTINELRDLLRISLENLYFYRDQARKYPEDSEISQKLKEAQDEVDDLKSQIEKLTVNP